MDSLERACGCAEWSRGMATGIERFLHGLLSLAMITKPNSNQALALQARLNNLH